ncbi:hypothetical protein SVAN01_02357 [Stagonosporopsis vannaccii]|nr:hypothetical protein SVAN01_02357 [Stagonosporopsis vannaccii]
MTLKLPREIILNILDQLVGSTPDRQPIFDLSNPVTKTLRALTLTSRSIYPVASRYLYRHCLFFRTRVSYACFRRTLGIHIGSKHPQSLALEQAGRNKDLWEDGKVPQYITSIFISPKEDISRVKAGSPRWSPHLQLEQLLDLFNIIGPTLNRLILDIEPFQSPRSKPERFRLLQSENNILLNMPNLIELTTSSGILDYSRILMPKIQRLAITLQHLNKAAMTFCFSSPSLNTLVLIRPKELSATDINTLFSTYKGQSLDIVFVDVNSNHRTPEDTRDWATQDSVRIWEADVPTSFYGDDDDFALCDTWIWTRACEGRLWETKEHRRMASWEEVKKRLAGPVHQILGNP